MHTYCVPGSSVLVGEAGTALRLSTRLSPGSALNITYHLYQVCNPGLCPTELLPSSGKGDILLLLSHLGGALFFYKAQEQSLGLVGLRQEVSILGAGSTTHWSSTEGVLLKSPLLSIV